VAGAGSEPNPTDVGALEVRPTDVGALEVESSEAAQAAIVDLTDTQDNQDLAFPSIDYLESVAVEAANALLAVTSAPLPPVDLITEEDYFSVAARGVSSWTAWSMILCFTNGGTVTLGGVKNARIPDNAQHVITCFDAHREADGKTVTAGSRQPSTTFTLPPGCKKWSSWNFGYYQARTTQLEAISDEFRKSVDEGLHIVIHCRRVCIVHRQSCAY
jgi:hypothetical protein